MIGISESWKSKPARLFVFLGGFFIANALIAEMIGVKIFSLEKTLGFDPWVVLNVGGSDLSFNLTAGVLLWPFVFVMTDVINEYFGQRGVKVLSYIAVGFIVYAFLVIFFAIQIAPADFWSGTKVEAGVPDMNAAFTQIFGQGLWIIVGSITAFLIGQIVDVHVFHQIRKRTGEKKVWLRATGSTLASQFIDSYVVLFIAFYIGAGWSIWLVLGIGLVNYIYKFIMAVLLTPVIYGMHQLIDTYLGKEVAEAMKQQAAID